MPEFGEEEIRARIGNGSILGISIDTAVFHGYRYNLGHPVLAKLDQFKVGGVELLLSEVVVREMTAHIADGAGEAQRALKTALREHEKLWKLGRERKADWEAYQIDVDPVVMAREQVKTYVEADLLPGDVLTLRLVCSGPKETDMKRSRFTEDQIIGVLKEHQAGLSAAELCRRHGISDATFYNWRSKYGGMEVIEAKRLKQLEDENAKLKKLLAESVMDVSTLREMLGKNF